MLKSYHIVWNHDKTEGIIVASKGVAYEARKGADSNCYDREGNKSSLAIKFCELYSHKEDCTVQTIELDVE